MVHILRVLSLFAIVLLPDAGHGDITFPASQVTEEETNLVFQRLHERAAGKSLTPADQEKRAKSLEPGVENLLQVQNRDENRDLYGSFGEVRPEGEEDVDFATGYFDPIRTLSSAFALPRCRFHEDPRILDAIHAGLQFTRKHVYQGCERPGNWWVWNKQMPDCLTTILALVSRDLEKEDREYLVSVLEDLIGKGPIPGSGYHTGKAGKDALNSLKLGIVTSDIERIGHAWECMENEVSPYLLEEDGTPLMTIIKPDFLGISLPYVYEGYNTVVDWMLLTHSTSYALRPQTIGKIVRYLHDLGRWNTFQGTEVAWLSFCPYRVFWRPPTTRSMAAKVAGIGVDRATELLEIAAGTDPPPQGCRFWPSAETVIFRGPGFFTALVMASKNRHPISSSYKNHFLHIGNKWYYGRDGHLVIARNSSETDPNLTYTTDWKRLTGTTVDDGSLLESKQMIKEDHGYWTPSYAYCMNPLAGAAILNGREGVAGIEIESGMVRARKSYFFLDEPEAIVNMGSHITGRGPTITTIHSLPIDPSPEIHVDGQKVSLHEGRNCTFSTPCWMHASAGGYFFPEEGAVTVIAETRSPDFSDHGDPPAEEQPQVPDQTFISLYFDHGEDPVDATYTYVFYPVAGASDMPDLVRTIADDLTFERTEVGHALRFHSFNSGVFFRPGQLNEVSMDRPGFLTYRLEGRNGDLAIYGPSWSECDLEVGFPFDISLTTDSPSVNAVGSHLRLTVSPGKPILTGFVAH